jgi:peptidoglycan hydrolase-like amidase
VSEESSEEISCDLFQTKIKIPSCPEEISYDTMRQMWVLRGKGEGHGRGFKILEAQALADAGWDAERILRWAYDIRR